MAEIGGFIASFERSGRCPPLAEWALAGCVERTGNSWESSGRKLILSRSMLTTSAQAVLEGDQAAVEAQGVDREGAAPGCGAAELRVESEGIGLRRDRRTVGPLPGMSSSTSKRRPPAGPLRPDGRYLAGA
jgi:hypothetical protein